MNKQTVYCHIVVMGAMLWLTGCADVITTAPCEEAWSYNRKIEIKDQAIPYMKTCGLNMATAKTLDDAYGNNKSISQTSVDSIYEILEGVDKVLTANNIPYFIQGGTMLGAARNGGLIPNDDDADISVLESDLPRVKALEAEFRKEGLVFPEALPWYGGINVKRDGSGSAYLDIFTISERTIDGKTWLAYATEDAFNSWPKDLVEPMAMNNLRRVAFGHLNLLALPEADAHKHLTVNYGNDWYTVTYKEYDHFQAKRLEKRKVNLKPEDYYYLVHSSKF